MATGHAAAEGASLGTQGHPQPDATQKQRWGEVMVVCGVPNFPGTIQVFMPRRDPEIPNAFGVNGCNLVISYGHRHHGAEVPSVQDAGSPLSCFLAVASAAPGTRLLRRPHSALTRTVTTPKMVSRRAFQAAS